MQNGNGRLLRFRTEKNHTQQEKRVGSAIYIKLNQSLTEKPNFS